MTKELKKRLITSIILFILALLCILINYIVFSIAAAIVLFICFDEWCGINYRYFSRKKPPLIFNPYFFVKFLGAFYLVIVFYSSLKLIYNKKQLQVMVFFNYFHFFHQKSPSAT